MQPALYRDLSHFDPTLPSYASRASTIARYRAMLTHGSALVARGLASQRELRFALQLDAEHGEVGAERYFRLAQEEMWKDLPSDHVSRT